MSLFSIKPANFSESKTRPQKGVCEMNAGGKSAEVKRKNLSPIKKDFCFAESVLKLHALTEYLEGRTPKEKHPFLFQEKINPPAKSEMQGVFFLLGVAG